VANRKNISVVIPVYNEEAVLPDLTRRLAIAADNADFDFEFVFVSDGSTDNSLGVLLALADKDKRIKIIELSRNFGHQIAISAGIDYVDSDAMILMDADLEDKPEDISKLIDKWRQGFDVVYVVRKCRKASFFKNICFAIFHRLNKYLSEVPLEPTGIFGLMDKKVIREIKQLREKSRYIPGLRSWVGFKQVSLTLERGERYDKKPRVGFGKLFNLALNSYFSFSKKPMRLAASMGFIFSFVSFIATLFIVIFQFLFKFKVSGWASLAAIILFVSSLQFACIGIMGEYISRIFDEAKERPLYIINKIYENKEVV